jgi:hypothetical protein
VCLAKISSALKMARFALCLGLKIEPGLGQEFALRNEDRRIVAGREILRNHGRNNISPPHDRVYPDPRTNHTNSLLLDFPGVQSVIPLGAYRMMFSHESFEIFSFHLCPLLYTPRSKKDFTFNPVAVLVPRMYPSMISRVLRGFPCQFVLM